MTTRPTTSVESDQLAQAAANILRTEEFVPKGKRWPFARVSKAHREYEKAVQEITVRRQKAREGALERKTKKAEAEADTVFERAKTSAQTAHDEKISEAKEKHDEVEAKARAERDAAVAVANRAYEQTMEGAQQIYQQEASTLDEKRNGLLSAAKAVRDEAYAAVDVERKADAAQIAKDLRTIALEGPMRIVEDRDSWSPELRRKALTGIVALAGEDAIDAENAELCLRNVAGYVFQDRYLKPTAQQHRLMSADLLEALVDLAQRHPARRPSIVKYMHEIVVQNPGHTSPGFIKSLTELYVAASSDTQTVYASDPNDNEQIVEAMRAHIADALKLTPRRSSIPAANSAPSAIETSFDDQPTPVMDEPSSADVTLDVNIGEIVQMEPDESSAPPEAAARAATKPPPAPSAAGKRPVPAPRGGRVRSTEGST